METYEQTMESFRECISLGFSVKEVISNLEEDENTNKDALSELKSYLKYGI